MISYPEAISRLAAQSMIVGAERCSTATCLRRVLASDVVAPFPSPRFDNAAMDGYAVRASDLGDQPLKVKGTIYAGESVSDVIQKASRGECIRIMTGAPIPKWVEIVVPLEMSQPLEGALVSLVRPAKDRSNIRRAGEDISAGQLILRAGTVMDATRIQIAASFGLSQLNVWQRPRIVLLPTGDELSLLGDAVKESGVYDSSRYFLHASLTEIGLEVAQIRVLPDDPIGALKFCSSDIERTDGPTIYISTGGVSVGDRDFVPSLLKDLGFEIFLHGVGIRPGKPVLIARKGPLYWIGLPGNPVATAVCWNFLARPLLAVIAGVPALRAEKACLSEDVRKPEAYTCFYRGTATNGQVSVFPAQGSAHVLASLEANAYIELPQGNSIIPAGCGINFYRIS